MLSRRVPCVTGGLVDHYIPFGAKRQRHERLLGGDPVPSENKEPKVLKPLHDDNNSGIPPSRSRRLSGDLVLLLATDGLGIRLEASVIAFVMIQLDNGTPWCLNRAEQPLQLRFPMDRHRRCCYMRMHAKRYTVDPFGVCSLLPITPERQS
jgi:hypothetical protein